MKFSYNWLKDLCGFEMRAFELSEKLSDAGFCVESCEPRNDDWLLDVEVTPNRADCLSHLGLAREVAAVTGGEVERPTPPTLPDATEPPEGVTALEVTAPELCPRYTALAMKDIQVGPSPQWMQDRLNLCGIRPVNNVVDITNYVLLETGQPLHAFDLEKLDNREIIVRRARDGETMTAIDGTECELRDWMCVIADAKNPVAIAGVMGGLDSEIGETTDELLLESARFDPVSVRRTARTLGLSSDSSYRFERGVDPELQPMASRRAAELISDLCGGTIVPGFSDIRSDSPETPEVTLRLDRLRLVLGVEVPRDLIVQIFRALELEITERTEERFIVRIPTWRDDLRREVDLIEEVARVYGYYRIGETTSIPVRPVRISDRERSERRTRRLLAGQGFHEAMSSSLVEADKLQQAQPWTDSDPLALCNPISRQKTHLRLSNMPALLETKKFNQARGQNEVDLFELGTIYVPQGSPDDELPDEKLTLTVLTDREEGFFVLKGLLLNLLDELGIDERPEERIGADGPFEEGRCLSFMLSDEPLGCVGILEEATAEEMDLENRPALMELDFEVLVEHCRFDRPYTAIPRYPSSHRDLAIVVDEKVKWAQVEECVQDASPEFLESVDFFDIYRGEQLPEGHKSVAFSLTFCSSERTLTNEEVDAAQQRIVDALKDELEATLRG